MNIKNPWENAKALYPVGAQAQGTVKKKFPFGVFLELSGAPDVIAFLDIASYNPAGEPPPAPLPDPGARVTGTIAAHNERDKQLRIRVGPPVHQIMDKRANDHT
ncbi:hypothetical protein NX794_14480 [Streptomyces sp. LP11]|uniref:S1 motif domain-containing protein n=1 Tax=Streptomyces pyxinicus TaxID=2970331 RepID=A0ABT2B1L2_9ACTN|nr:hypothetical protein [Streptomyces sp. LP11]MCS0602408.1 hypothetical protein [Streptomyces sp. LP11]